MSSVINNIGRMVQIKGNLVWTITQMRCPYCGIVDVGVLESRLAEDDTSVRRRRECNRCNKRFTTYERVEIIDLIVVKKDGRKEPFDREKLKKGLIRATWKRQVSMSDIEKLIDDVERKLRLRQSTEFKSFEVGRLVLNRLKKLDIASYLAFASVYNNFEGIDDYRQALEKVVEGNGTNRGRVNGTVGNMTAVVG